MRGFLFALLLMASCGVAVVGAGCQAYGTARQKMPDPAEIEGTAFARWFDALDEAMTTACRR